MKVAKRCHAHRVFDCPTVFRLLIRCFDCDPGLSRIFFCRLLIDITPPIEQAGSRVGWLCFCELAMEFAEGFERIERVAPEDSAACEGQEDGAIEDQEE